MNGMFRQHYWLPALALLLLMTVWFLMSPRNPAQHFQDELDALREAYGLPGATAAYLRSDGSSGVAASGFADVEAGVLMTPDSRMLAASVGKTFVGATTVALAREGLLNLDDPLSRWLGERTWFSRLPNHDAITLRHLLTHSAGLPDHVHTQRFAADVSRRWQEKENPFPPETLIEYVLDLAPLFEAGKGWAYSDTGYILLGLVIEKVTGRHYFDEINRRFLAPLGLQHTAPANRRELPGLAAGYMSADNAFGLPHKTTSEQGVLRWHPGMEWTGGGLVSNSTDLAHWGAALFNGQAMPGAYLEELLHSVATDPHTPDLRYAAGVAVMRTGTFGPVYGHGGWIPGYCTSLRHYPEHGVTIAFQINTDTLSGTDTTQVIREMEAHLAAVVINH